MERDLALRDHLRDLVGRLAHLLAQDVVDRDLPFQHLVDDFAVDLALSCGFAPDLAHVGEVGSSDCGRVGDTLQGGLKFLAGFDSGGDHDTRESGGVTETESGALHRLKGVVHDLRDVLRRVPQPGQLRFRLVDGVETLKALDHRRAKSGDTRRRGARSARLECRSESRRQLAAHALTGSAGLPFRFAESLLHSPGEL